MAKASDKGTLFALAMMLSFIGGVLFFKAMMMLGDYSMLKNGSFLTNEVINRDYVLKSDFDAQQQILSGLQARYDELATRKLESQKLYQARLRYEKELKVLFEQGLAISKTYRATNKEAEAGNLWEDKARQVLTALTRIETQIQGRPVPLDFQGNFIWYNETNPNYRHAREIVRDRLNDMRHAMVVLDTSGPIESE